jgi:hypothetical protein
MNAALPEALLAVAAVGAGVLAAAAPGRLAMVAGVVAVALVQAAVWAGLGLWPLVALDLLMNAALVGWLLLRAPHAPAASGRTPSGLRAAVGLAGAVLAAVLARTLPAPAPRDLAAIALACLGLAAALAGSGWLRRLAGFNLLGAGVLLVVAAPGLGTAGQVMVAAIMLVAAAITALAVRLLRAGADLAARPAGA